MLLRNRETIQGESATKGHVQHLNFGEACEQGWRNANVRKQEKEIVVSVVLVVIRRGVIATGPHITAAVGSKLKTLCAFPLGRYLHAEGRCVYNKLCVTVVTVGHVTAAVSCCLEMALWGTLWMADQVSRMASGGLSASRMRLLMNFLACGAVNEGDEAYTTNLCQKCCNKHLQAKGEKPLSNVQWRQVVEKKAYRGRMWKMMGKEPYLCGMWELLSCERSKAKKFQQLADEEKQAGIQGQWPPAREYLEQVKCCHDTDCNEKNGFTALKNGTWEEYKETFMEKMKASE